MFVNVSEINFMIGLDNICIEKTYRKTLISYADTDILSLLCSINTEDIKNFKEEDFKEICNYFPNTNRFFGMEYSILRYLIDLIDYHLEDYKRDLRSGRLNEIIKLSVSKDKLIIKVFPSKTTANNQVLYTISLLYLLLFQLFGLVNKEWYKEEGLLEKYTNKVIDSVFTRTKPIVTKVVYTLSINADDSYTWFSQLQQLKSEYPFLDITSQEDQVKFCFRPRTHYLTSTLDFPVINNVPSDTNYEARFIETTCTLEKDNTLTYKTTIVSKEMVDSVFATQIDECDEPASIYSALSYDEEIYLNQYLILRQILTFTKQHEQRKSEIEIKAQEYVEQGKYNTIEENSDTDKIKWLSKEKTIEHAFDNMVTVTPDDKLIPVICKELQKLGQKNAYVDYIILVLTCNYIETIRNHKYMNGYVASNKEANSPNTVYISKKKGLDSKRKSKLRIKFYDKAQELISGHPANRVLPIKEPVLDMNIPMDYPNGSNIKGILLYKMNLLRCEIELRENNLPYTTIGQIIEAIENGTFQDTIEDKFVEIMNNTVFAEPKNVSCNTLKELAATLEHNSTRNYKIRFRNAGMSREYNYFKKAKEVITREQDIKFEELRTKLTNKPNAATGAG